MAGDMFVTVVGNLTGDPELRYVSGGAAVANFTVAHTPRSYDTATGEWIDGQTLYLRCSVWRDQAENVAKSLLRSARVVVYGRLRARTYTAKDGEQRTTIELEAEEVSASLRYAEAKLTRTRR